MKMIKITSVVLVLVMLTTVACKDEFLEIAPTSSLSDAELSTESGLDGNLTGVYTLLRGNGGFYDDMGNWFWGTVRGGEANKGSNDGDQAQVNEIMRYAPQSNNASIEQKYQRAFEGVARANNTMRLLQNPDPGAGASELVRIEGETRFLRALYYFELARIFGDDRIPYVDETWDEVEPINAADSLYRKIEEDFTFAYSNLQDQAPATGRANKWAARAFLGKVQLYQGKFAEAKESFDDCIANGMTANGTAYALVSDYATLFRSATETNSESIFAIQAAAGTGTVQNANSALVLNFPHGSSGPARPGGCCGFNQPSLSLANAFITSGGLPADGELNTDLGLSSADAFTPYEGELDPRIDHSIGRRGIDYWDWGPHPGFDWIRDQAHAGPYSPKKFVYTTDGSESDATSWTPGYTSVNQNLMRYADLLLMAAEAEIELGNVDVAVGYINQVRARANNSKLQSGGANAANYNIAQYGTLSADDARTAVRKERLLELSGEGHRFFDLVRWGVAAAELNAYIAYESSFLPTLLPGASFDAGADEYLPIPQSQIDLQGEEVFGLN